MVALHMVESDEQLVDRSLRGEREAFDQLVQRYQAPVYHFALRFCGHPDDARELAQDIFVRVWQKLSTFRPGLPFRPWLYRVAGSVCLNHAARRRPATVSLAQDGDTPGPEPAALEPDPAELAATADLRRQLYEAVAQLPASYRAVILLRHLEGLDYRQIAASLELPLGTVKTQLHRARHLLRERLGPQFGAPGEAP
jgi:RNA polymerase sigma-70 factor, ECF subfamily